jgi:hypothetical protein
MSFDPLIDLLCRGADELVLHVALASSREDPMVQEFHLSLKASCTESQLARG